MGQDRPSSQSFLLHKEEWNIRSSCSRQVSSGGMGIVGQVVHSECFQKGELCNVKLIK